MAGPATILNPDTDVQAEKKWQLLKSLSGVQTSVNSPRLGQNLNDVSFIQDTIEFLNVSRYEAIKIMILGAASDGHNPVLTLYGWDASGPGVFMGSVQATFGTHTSAASTGFHASLETHKSIRAAFLPATEYRLCDTHVVADYELEMGISYEEDWDGAGFIANYYTTHKSISSSVAVTGAPPSNANGPIPIIVDFSRSRYEYFGILVPTLNSATTVGAIWKPLSLRKF
ncbi:hypothetical protein LCGC14_0782630 [marine sediment metagenome]|uniref:Uncharacterized protein n=1 Tax=marine sediment metagenome TaxID=412755 RepID=A0A0F9PZ93_9ZZZZ